MSVRTDDINLFAVIGTFNEEDIIYATVKNAFAQGCSKVFIVDNCSADGTLVEAVKAGAVIAHSFETSVYDEMQRIRIMNDAVHKISIDSELDAIWWLWLDADEFPHGANKKTILDFLTDLDVKYRVVGSSQVNHFPTEEPYYIPRFHPFDFQPFGETFDTTTFPVLHCKAGHWKHPLMKYLAGQPVIRAKSGFHMAYCSEVLYEPEESVVTHHFPFRGKEETFKRYGFLASGDGARNAYNDEASLQGTSAITRRYENLEKIYKKDWTNVYINPAPISTKSVVGVKPECMISEVPVWYSRKDLYHGCSSLKFKIVFFCMTPGEIFSGGRYHAYIMASSLADFGHDVYFVTNNEPIFLDDLKFLSGFDKINMLISDDFSKMPESKCDVVIWVPHFNGHSLAKIAGDCAKRSTACMMLINFETPNWFNLYAQNKRNPSIFGCVKRIVSTTDCCVISSAKESQMFAKEFFAEYLQNTSFGVWSPPINTVAADMVQDIAARENEILIITRLTGKHKGFDDVNALLCSELYGYTITLISGYADMEDEKEGELKARADKFEIKINVVVKPSDQEKFRIIKRSKLMVFPSYFEGYGYPPLEAIYCGTPCVAYELPVLRETCGDALIYVERGNREQLRCETINACLAGVEIDEQDLSSVRELVNYDNSAEKIERLVREYVFVSRNQSKKPRRRGLVLLCYRIVQKMGRVSLYRKVRARVAQELDWCRRNDKGWLYTSGRVVFSLFPEKFKTLIRTIHHGG